VFRVPVLADGSAGTLTVFAQGSDLVTADGVAFDVKGGLWVAVNHSTGGGLVRVTPDGSISSVASDPGWLDYPTQAAFGTTPGSRTTLYIENGSYNNGTPNIVSVHVGLHGELLP
jgi:sugar lactone lactonase YvrE